MNYYEHHLGDWAKKCSGLSLIEEGAYRRLLDLYYIAEGPLPADKAQIFKEARAFKKTEKDAVSFVLYKFFTLTDRGYLNARAEQEIARFKTKSEKARKSAEARWTRDSSEVLTCDQPVENDANAYANASPEDMRTHCEGNAPRARPQSPVTSINTKDKLTLVCSRPPAGNSEPTDEGEGKKLNGNPGPPDCPHVEVLALWAEVMPDQPQHDPTRWNGKRATHLRARWRETAIAKGWQTQAEGLAYLRKFFAWCRRSQFLMGKVPPRAGHRQFELELAWLVNPENWTKAHEGKYHSEG